MDNWKIFELDCTDYLNKKYGENFTHLGFSDSTVSDIKYENNSKLFYIEAKMPSAQSGQFVLLPDYEKKEFVFSTRNKTKQNENTDFIIQYMNKNFERYANAGTTGEDIEIDQKIFNSWIVNAYKEKMVKFFITKGDNYIIFPIEKYGEYFSITAKYRIKKSGSSKVPKISQKDVLEKIKSMSIKFKLLDDFEIESSQDLNKMKFKVLDSDYMFSRKHDNVYRIRKLSNTRNANVIFSIQLLKEQDSADLKNFISNL